MAVEVSEMMWIVKRTFTLASKVFEITSFFTDYTWYMLCTDLYLIKLLQKCFSA
jgi:hypothetical protein